MVCQGIQMEGSGSEKAAVWGMGGEESRIPRGHEWLYVTFSLTLLLYGCLMEHMFHLKSQLGKNA